MPMRYANVSDVNRILFRSEGTVDPSSEDTEQLVRIENGIADMLDGMVGRTFGAGTSDPVTRSVMYRSGQGWQTYLGYWYPLWLSPFIGDYGPGYTPQGADARTIILGTRIREVTGIETGGTWNGSGWDDGETLGSDAYMTVFDTDRGAWGIRHESGEWSGIIRITGYWDDGPVESVPDDVREFVTAAVADQWRILHASPVTETLGPDTASVSTRNVWRSPQALALKDRYKVRYLVV